MAKKFVRGITDIKNIEHQDFDTNNVNDLLSDGKHNFIHRKKQDGSEEYHNLTNNIKTIESSNTSLLSVTNYNNTTNSARLTPKHDRRKEQVLESTDETIVISHGENGTEETTNVDVNPTKVLEHDNLHTSYGISKTTSGNTTTLALECTRVDDGFDLNNLTNGLIRGNNLVNAPVNNALLFVSTFSHSSYAIQRATQLSQNTKSFVRYKSNGVWGAWREQVGDKSAIDTLLAKKEQLLESTDDTIVISHGENGTSETTTVDVNPKIVLEHDNLVSNSEYVTIEHEENSATTEIKTDELDSKIIEIEEKIPKAVSLLNLAQDTSLIWTPYEDITENNNWDYKLCELKYGNETGIYNNTKINLSVYISADEIELDSEYTPKIYLNSYDVKKDGTGNDWNVETDCFLGKFTKTLVAGDNYYVVKASMTTLPNAETLYSSIVPQIRIDGASSGKFHVRALMVTTGDMMPDYWLPSVNDNQIFTRQTYTHANGILKTHAKSLYQNYIISTLDEEFNFLAKMNKTQTTAEFTLNEHDSGAFENLINTYGENGTVNISGCVFSLTESTLTFNCDSATDNPYIVTFSDIITKQTE